MRRSFRVTWLAMLLVLAVALEVASAAKVLTVKEIMGKLNKGPTALTPTLGRELRQNPPAWDDIQTHAKEFAELVEALGQNDPPRGEKASWQVLTKQYLKNAKALDEAARKKDKKEAQAAHAKLTAACKNCHTAHRGGS